MSGLTVQTVTRNEPFVYYAVKSVYDYADTILLYDTGSSNQLALDGIARLIKEDVKGKIKFKSFPIANTTRMMTREIINALGPIRQQQIDETNTEFFLVVDADEVHYREGIRRIVEEVLPNWPLDRAVCYLPIRWHTQLQETVGESHAPSRVHGRVFRTRDVVIRVERQGEIHCSKKTGRILYSYGSEAFVADQLPAFAHFSIYLKPWNHVVTRGQRRFGGPLPEVMCEDDSFLRRFFSEGSHYENCIGGVDC